MDLRYEIEWIHTQTKMSDQGSLELALIMKKKERRKERITNGYFFEHLILAYTVVLMNDLAVVKLAVQNTYKLEMKMYM